MQLLKLVTMELNHFEISSKFEVRNYASEERKTPKKYNIATNDIFR